MPNATTTRTPTTMRAKHQRAVSMLARSLGLGKVQFMDAPLRRSPGGRGAGTGARRGRRQGQQT